MSPATEFLAGKERSHCFLAGFAVALILRFQLGILISLKILY